MANKSVLHIDETTLMHSLTERLQVQKIKKCNSTASVFSVYEICAVLVLVFLNLYHDKMFTFRVIIHIGY